MSTEIKANNLELNNVEVEEFERQFHHIQNIKKIDFYSPSYNYKSYEESEKEIYNQKSKDSFASASVVDDGIVQEKSFVENEIIQNDIEQPIPTSAKPLDIIHQKILKLDSFFSTVNDVKPIGGPDSYEPVLDEKTRETLALNKEKEQKQINLFSGIFSMKSVIYYKKNKISPPPVLQIEENEVKKAPKLVELFQYSGYDNLERIRLPHDVKLNEIQNKVIDSILILNKQPSYKDFLSKLYFSKQCRQLISDSFWYCFLERYQKQPAVQRELFRRVSDNYVDLIFSDMDFRYRDTFLTKFADLLSQSVYAIFVTCFPDSYMSQFNDEFREFICQILHSWISGCKPSPRSFERWNLEKLDPATAVFAKEVLNKNPNSMEDSLGLGNTGLTSNLTHSNQDSSMKSKLSSTSRSRNISRSNISYKKNAYSASIIPSRRENLPSVMTETASTKSARTVRDVQPIKQTLAQSLPSHPIGSSHLFEESLFDLYGHSPLVEYYLYNNKARKINTTETLIQHQFVASLPPLNAPTYRDEIKASKHRIKELENDLKTVQSRQKMEIHKMQMERINYMKEYKRNQEILFTKKNAKEVSVMGELLTMNSKRDANTTTFNLEAALMKAFKNSAIKSK